MRNLFFALVLANLAFAALRAWVWTEEPTSRPPPRPAPSITLVSELPADAVEQVAPRAPSPSGATNAAAAPPPAAVDAVAAAPAGADVIGSVETGAAVERGPAEAPAPARRCVSVGPFRELAQAAGAASSLRAAGYEPTQRVAEGEIWIGYWVYIQAIPTEAEADAILERVRAAGLTDSYVIPNSDSGNLVSIGVFTEIGGVTRRREEVRALGYEPTVVDRTRRATVYWVDVLLGADQTLDLESLQTPGRILRLEQRSCPAPPA